MMPTDRHSESIKLPETYAVDTTFLLAANSALFPTEPSGLQDQDHVRAFETLVTYLANGKSFHYVRPGTSQVDRTFPVYDLLASFPERAKTVGLTPEGLDEVWEAAAEDFSKYVIYSGGEDVLAWVRFQFDDERLIQVFFDGGEDQQVERLIKASTVLKRVPKFSELQSKWVKAGAETIIPYGRHPLMSIDAFEKFTDYVLAYAFFGFAKGQFYPLQLVNEQRHCVHWLRKIAGEMLERRLSGGDGSAPGPSAIELTDSPKSGLCFNWGSVVLKLANHDEKLKSVNQLREVVQVLERETTQDALAAILAAGHQKTREAAALEHRKACEDFATSTLLKTGWEPTPVDQKTYGSRAKAITGLLAGILGAAVPTPSGADPAVNFLGSVLLAGASQLIFQGEPHWYSRADFRTKRRFFRERLFKTFSDEPIATAVDEFLKEYSTKPRE